MIYCHHHLQGFDYAEEQNMAFKMSSFAETMALGYLKSQVDLCGRNNRSDEKTMASGDDNGIYLCR